MLRKILNVIITVMIFMSLTMTVSNGAEVSDLVIKYGTSSITAKLLDDFSKSEVDESTVWQDGFVEMKDGKVLYDGIGIADAYTITVPNAQENKELYAKAKYIGFEIKNASDGDVYYCYQHKSPGGEAFTSPSGEPEIVLVDKNGVTQDIVFSDSATVYSRYGFIIPEGFDGYVLIPTSRITRLNDWNNSVWSENLTINGIGAHVSIGQNSTPEADASFIEFYIDNFFVYNGEFPEYVAPVTPEPTQSPTPTPSPTPTATPEATSTPVKTGSTKTEKPDNNNDGNFKIWPIIVAAAVVVVLVVVLVLLKSKKKK